jgi:hypothetical protein
MMHFLSGDLLGGVWNLTALFVISKKNLAALAKGT